MLCVVVSECCSLFAVCWLFCCLLFALWCSLCLVDWFVCVCCLAMVVLSWVVPDGW